MHRHWVQCRKILNEMGLSFPDYITGENLNISHIGSMLHMYDHSAIKSRNTVVSKERRISLIDDKRNSLCMYSYAALRTVTFINRCISG